MSKRLQKVSQSVEQEHNHEAVTLIQYFKQSPSYLGPILNECEK
jgi:hypothetical protein